MERNKEYLDSIVTGLKELIKNDVETGIEKSYTEYMNWALDQLRRHHRYVKKYLILDTDKDVNRVWDEIKPEVLTSVEKLHKDIKHRKLTKEIKATSARAVIREAMKEAGLKHNFIGQTYRAKVSVLITDNRVLTVYLSYKKLNEILPQVIESIQRIRKELQSLGNVSINKSYYIQNWEE